MECKKRRCQQFFLVRSGTKGSLGIAKAARPALGRTGLAQRTILDLSCIQATHTFRTHARTYITKPMRAEDHIALVASNYRQTNRHGGVHTEIHRAT